MYKENKNIPKINTADFYENFTNWLVNIYVCVGIKISNIRLSNSQSKINIKNVK